jgi:uncharacterized membrane protein HdeD (DUF308 family)
MSESDKGDALSHLRKEQMEVMHMAKENIAEHRSWFIALGVLLIVLGIVAIAFPFLSTIATKIFLGWLFIIGGVSQIVHSFSTQKWSQFFLNLLVGLLYLAAGAWLAFFPLTGILTLTIFLAVMFIFEGVLEAAMAFRMRPQDGWGWMLTAGIVAILAGILIMAQLPSSAIWAIGLLAGINIISTGFAYLFLALRAEDAKTAAALAH